ncbi:MAG: hypothetical protein R2780_14050 [Crocinitomicaceae bacterium]
MENDQIRSKTIKWLVSIVVILFLLVSLLGLFDHPYEVITLAIPMLAFILTILGMGPTKWILISGIVTVAILIVEILVNIFYYHHIISS